MVGSFTVQKLDQLYVVVSFGHKTTCPDMICIVLKAILIPKQMKSTNLHRSSKFKNQYNRGVSITSNNILQPHLNLNMCCYNYSLCFTACNSHFNNSRLNFRRTISLLVKWPYKSGDLVWTPNQTLCRKVCSCLPKPGTLQCRIVSFWYVLASSELKSTRRDVTYTMC